LSSNGFRPRRKSLEALPLPPVFLADRIETLPDATEHIIWDDGQL
jgi:hypothetical protein